MRLAAITDVDAFSAIPAYVALLGGDLTALDGLDASSAINPSLLALLGGDINTRWPTCDPGYDALSAIDVVLRHGGDVDGGVFTGGGIDALAN